MKGESSVNALFLENENSETIKQFSFGLIKNLSIVEWSICLLTFLMSTNSSSLLFKDLVMTSEADLYVQFQ